MILEPLSEDTFDENEKDLMKNSYEKINNLLDDLKYNDKMNLNQLTARLPTVRLRKKKYCGKHKQLT